MSPIPDPASLPEHLRERVRVDTAAPVSGGGSDGEFVLYWMHHAVRADENAALDVANLTALALDRPLLVYQGLGGAHPHNSDRHHTFILEGARDVARDLAARGIRHVFHLPGDTAGGSPLRALARRAALVITEEFPVPPFPRWTRALGEYAGGPVWCVDTACVVPMQSVGRAFDRAFAFRRAIEKPRARRIDDEWPATPDVARRFDGDPGFDTLDLEVADIADLCARCDIDHSVGPVLDTVGGARAGLARWAEFRERGLKSYDRLRNDAAVAPPRGVSRLSPYLHHGHVAPTRIAREAAQANTSGARKFIDELVIWRELAHNFCFHNRERLGAVVLMELLPGWARETLREHATDERFPLHSLETLGRGRTGDELWDLAARALLARGGLHNNLRMTWGKAIHGWSASPEQSLARLFDLNDRHALDGGDPNSYGGLLYSLGLFDRAFTPAKPVFGTVRGRSTENHAQRLDLAAYTRHAVDRPTPARVAVIGAGISGLAAARTLADQGIEVSVFERSRGAGGRAATRRADVHRFDHGAQYFTARDPRFRRVVDAWLDDGIAATWEGRIVHRDAAGQVRDVEGGPRFVGMPGMRALGAHLASDLPVRFETGIDAIERTASGWHLASGDQPVGEGFDALVLAMAPEQALRLLAEDDVLRNTVAGCPSLPCHATLIAFDERLDVDFDGAFLDDDYLAWIARDSSKPGRPGGERWVLHSTPQWSAPRTETDRDTIAEAMLEAFERCIGIPLPTVTYLAGHRWGLARVEDGAGVDCLFDADRTLALCGDWCPGSRVEGAYLSGVAAAGRVAGRLRTAAVEAACAAAPGTG